MSDAGTTAHVSTALADLAAGLPGARDRLLARTQERLWRLASRSLDGFRPIRARGDQTDDVMQTLFVRLLREWDRTLAGDDGKPLTDPAVYLCRVSRLLREVLHDELRKVIGRGGTRPKVQPIAPPDDRPGGHDPDDDTLDPAKLAVFTEFHRAVDDLPDDLRRVVDLHYYQELSHAEVGGLLGVAEITARKHWVKARLLLIARLGVNPFGPDEG